MKRRPSCSTDQLERESPQNLVQCTPLPRASSPRSSRKRKNATTACRNCRSRRVKCSGSPPPCTKCHELNLGCHFDANSDRRSKMVIREKLAKLEGDSRLLNTLLITLGDASHARAAHAAEFAQSDVLDQNTPGDLSNKNIISIDRPHSTTGVGNKTSNKRSSPQYTSVSPLPLESGNSDVSDDIQESVSSPGTRTSKQTFASPSDFFGLWRRIRNRQEGNVDATHISPGAVRSFGNFAMSNAVLANQYPASVQARQLSVIHERIEMMLPLHIQPDIDCDSIANRAVGAVLSFQEAARNQLVEGVNAREVLSMDSFELDLLTRDRVPSDGHTVSGWACEWGKAWTGYPVELRLAAVHYMGPFLRWLIMPCKETYAMMPSVVRPLLCQLIIPHTLDIDLWGSPPIMREMQLLYDKKMLDHVTPNSQQLRWPRGFSSCTEQVQVACDAAALDAIADGQGGHYRLAECLAPAFIACINEADSWSLHRDLLSELPALVGRVRFHDG